jgi:hypothetical protein
MQGPAGGRISAEVAEHPFYRRLLQTSHEQPVEDILLGRVWTLCRAGEQIGMAMSPAQISRTLPWSGRLRGRPLSELATWVTSWDAHEASVGMAAVNAALQARRDGVLGAAVDLAGEGPGNLAVFEWFKPQLAGCRVVVVGRYPGLQRYVEDYGWQVLERDAGDEDWPDPACEYLLPRADWVFLTATSILNKTFPRLATLAASARLVLLGPTAPWLEELRDFGVDYIAGVKVYDPDRLWQTVQEGGGARIFDQGVRYCVADLHQDRVAGACTREVDTASGARH